MSRLFGPRWHPLLVCSRHNGVFLGQRSEAREGDGDREDSHIFPVKPPQPRGPVPSGHAAEPVLRSATLRCWISPKGAGKGVIQAARASVAQDGTGEGSSTSTAACRVSVSSIPMAFSWKWKKKLEHCN